MASATSNVASIQQSFMNRITQQNQQNCVAQSSNSANGNVVIVNGANIQGDFTGVAVRVNTDATCLLVSNMEDSVESILRSTTTQTNKAQTDWFNGFQFTSETNSFNLGQSVTNNISQINQATCSSNSTTSASNNYVYVANTRIGGNFVGVTLDSRSSASCSITNTMKNTTYNEAQGNLSQNNTIQGIFASYLAAFAAIIGIIVIAVIILFSIGTFKYINRNQTPSLLEQQNQEIALAEQLGITG